MIERVAASAALLAFALAFVIVLASALLRLIGLGTGCEPWPACYGLASTFEAVQASVLVQGLRATHRAAASLFALAALACVALGWQQARASMRAVLGAMLVLTVGLAAAGRFSASASAPVTFLNAGGGLALLALVGTLCAEPRRTAPPGAALACLVLVLQALLGTGISVARQGAAALWAANAGWLVVHAAGGAVLAAAAVAWLARRGETMAPPAAFAAGASFVAALTGAWCAAGGRGHFGATAAHLVVAAAAIAACGVAAGPLSRRAA